MASTVEANTRPKGVLSGATAQEVNSHYPVPIPSQSSPAPDRSSIACGHCFCGKVQMELPLDLKPIMSAVCHCTDCREWHSVGSVPVMAFPLVNLSEGKGEVPIKVTSGADLLAWVHRSPAVRRYFATCCGTRLFLTAWEEKAGMKVCTTFPTMFPTVEWQPAMHVFVRESNYPTMDIPRFNDVPAEFGGTGTRQDT